MTSLDQKCVRETRKWRPAVRIPLAIILVLYMKYLAQKRTGKIRFRKTHVCDHL